MHICFSELRKLKVVLGLRKKQQGEWNVGGEKNA